MEQTTSFVVVGEKISLRVRGIIDAKKWNVVDYRWVLECIERKTYEFPAMEHVSERSAEREFIRALFMVVLNPGYEITCRCAGVPLGVQASHYAFEYGIEPIVQLHGGGGSGAVEAEEDDEGRRLSRICRGPAF